MNNRLTYEDGELDEIVTNGGAHLERMDDDEWFLECVRSDGSSVAVWISGTVRRVEEREARKEKA